MFVLFKAAAKDRRIPPLKRSYIGRYEAHRKPAATPSGRVGLRPVKQQVGMHGDLPGFQINRYGRAAVAQWVLNRLIQYILFLLPAIFEVNLAVKM